MNFICIGVHYKTCCTTLREPLTFTKTQTTSVLERLKAHQITEVVLLATCHRTEFYLTDVACIPKLMHFIVTLYQERGGTADIRPYLTLYQGTKAIRHLLNVTAGLDSLVLGEDQILGQVKNAVELAQQAQTLGKITHKCFREAITLAKKIKSQLKISHYPLSISHIAIQFLKEKMGTLENRTGLIIGLGQMNALAISYLLSEPIDTLYVTNRTHGKAVQLKENYDNIIPIAYDARYTYLNQVDFVICATASPHVVLQQTQMPTLTHPIYMIDMAMPCDIERSIEALPMAHVYHLEDLEAITSQNQAIRTNLAGVASLEVAQKTQQLMHWLDNLEIEQLADDLDTYCQTVKAHTLQFLKHHLQQDTPDDLLDYVMTETLKRCIRQPIAHLMTLEDETQRKQEADTLRILFGLETLKEP